MAKDDINMVDGVEAEELKDRLYDASNVDAKTALTRFAIDLYKQEGTAIAENVLLSLKRDLCASVYTDEDTANALGITTKELKERLCDASKIDIKTAFILSEMLGGILTRASSVVPW